ncbi:hypothetical protein [Streptomyces scabiei]|uniref:hypothetical protein n=1 Tax=Streptomyces TaxID=1883 RepID=UPI0029B5FF1F|nr:hypothetical protein [Streptomyces scabiei]MDX3114504.1 hypothetical protein [Streptomyces scabiei]
MRILAQVPSRTITRATAPALPWVPRSPPARLLAVGVVGGMVAADVVDEAGDFFEGDEEDED